MTSRFGYTASNQMDKTNAICSKCKKCNYELEWVTIYEYIVRPFEHFDKYLTKVLNNKIELDHCLILGIKGIIKRYGSYKQEKYYKEPPGKFPNYVKTVHIGLTRARKLFPIDCKNRILFIGLFREWICNTIILLRKIDTKIMGGY